MIMLSVSSGPCLFNDNTKNSIFNNYYCVKLFSFNVFCDSFDAIAFTIIVWIFLLLFSENVHVVCKLFSGFDNYRKRAQLSTFFAILTHFDPSPSRLTE